MANFIKINENDNVAVALDVIPENTAVNVAGSDEKRRDFISAAVGMYPQASAENGYEKV